MTASEQSNIRGWGGSVPLNTGSEQSNDQGVDLGPLVTFHCSRCGWTVRATADELVICAGVRGWHADKPVRMAPDLEGSRS